MQLQLLLGIALSLFVLIVVLALTVSIINKTRPAFVISEGFAGLLYYKGQFVEILGPGRHLRWGSHYTMNIVDVRKSFINVAGQEVLTADNVGVKLSLLLSYQVKDPIKAAHQTQNWQTDLYNSAQVALRTAVGNVPVEALLEKRLNIGAELLARVQADAKLIGINVLAVEVKDVMFPAEIKRAFAEVLKAKQEGQAALERARGESAALRNLANAARVLDGNPSLMNLRMLQSISAAQNAGNTLVVGMPTGFVPVKNGRSNTEGESRDS